MKFFLGIFLISALIGIAAALLAPCTTSKKCNFRSQYCVQTRKREIITVKGNCVLDNLVCRGLAHLIRRGACIRERRHHKNSPGAINRSRIPPA
ncbi:hypothetical protein Trydic_g5656 [Trypoxylus dichotomus]